MTATQRRDYLQRAERMTNKLIRKYQRRIQADLDAQAQDLITAVNQGGAQAVNQVDFGAWDARLMDTYAHLFQESFLVAANATYTSTIREARKRMGMGKAESWTLDVQDWLRQHGLKLVTTITGNSRQLYLDIANQAIQEGIDQGLGASDVQKLITQRLADQNYTYSAHRALRIARTETIRAANEGHMKGAAELPFLVNKTWIAAHDARTRRIPDDAFDHWELDGVVVPEDQPFVSTSRSGATVEAMQPGDIEAPAGFTINCRCRVAFIPRRDAQGRLIPRPALGAAPAPARPAIPAVQLVPTGQPVPVPGPPAPPPPPKPGKYIFEPGKTETETRANLKKHIEEHSGYLGVREVKNEFTMTHDELKKRSQRIADLYREYQIDQLTAKKSAPVIGLESSPGAYGFVQPGGGGVTEVNFGHRSDPYSRQWNFVSKSATGDKSRVDKDNTFFATIVHEFGHAITIDRGTSLRAADDATRLFWEEMKSIRLAYGRELGKLGRAGKYEERTAIHLGKYAHTNLDEFLAEGFTEYKLSSTPGKYAKKIGELIDKTYKRK